MATGEFIHRSLAIQRIDEVDATVSVRHLDELAEPVLERFIDAVESGSAIGEEGDSPFEPGDVVVYTDYYRIEEN